jgi:hypothetical protein
MVAIATRPVAASIQTSEWTNHGCVMPRSDFLLMTAGAAELGAH